MHLRGGILEGDVLGDEILALHDGAPAAEGAGADDAGRLVVLDLGGGVVPRQHGGLGADSGERDEVLGLGHVEGLAVDARRHPDHGAARVAEGHNVYGFLHRAAVGAAVLRHCDYSGPHGGAAVLEAVEEKKDKYWEWSEKSTDVEDIRGKKVS